MVKKLFQSLIVGILVFSVAVLAGYFAYMLTYRYQTQKIQEQLSARTAVSATPVYNDTLLPSNNTVTAQYLARLENGDISIYTFHDGKESFLYTLDIYPGDLSQEDLSQLRSGVLLTSKQALTSFEEDFTS